jgi:hypothetical protein
MRYTLEIQASIDKIFFGYTYISRLFDWPICVFANAPRIRRRTSPPQHIDSVIAPRNVQQIHPRSRIARIDLAHISIQTASEGGLEI